MGQFVLATCIRVQAPNRLRCMFAISDWASRCTSWSSWGVFSEVRLVKTISLGLYTLYTEMRGGSVWTQCTCGRYGVWGLTMGCLWCSLPKACKKKQKIIMTAAPLPGDDKANHHLSATSHDWWQGGRSIYVCLIPIPLRSILAQRVSWVLSLLGHRMKEATKLFEHQTVEAWNFCLRIVAEMPQQSWQGLFLSSARMKDVCSQDAWMKHPSGGQLSQAWKACGCGPVEFLLLIPN